ncbi:MAG: hypothetical protein CVU63_12180 [Deltaproteobacteria bacterium HGW-Deltaproteobacteria-20]|nr:MAG: hypothetical protein CVU63_12180 [Deltaproteobacteria bacterium HGW-Deltaproteobacteria-20]
MDTQAEYVAASLVAILLLASSCSHDWDALEPNGAVAEAGPDASGGSGGSGGGLGGTSGDAGAGATGGTGATGGNAGDAGTGGTGGGTTDCDEPGAQFWPKNGHCYFVLGAGANDWSSQGDACASSGAYLVTITSQDEQSFVAPLVEDQDRWIGYQRTGAEFEWVTGEPTDFENWGQGEPNESDDACARIRPNGTWADRGCSSNYGAICERE